MTYVFQIFVFMQVFNQFNARILTADFNIFQGIFRNWLFLAVCLSTVAIQMVMVEVGGRVMKTEELTLGQNGICLLIGLGEILWGVFIKFVPVKFFQCYSFEEKPMTPEEMATSTLGKFKKGSTAAKPKSKEGKAMLKSVEDKLRDDFARQLAKVRSAE